MSDHSDEFVRSVVSYLRGLPEERVEIELTNILNKMSASYLHNSIVDELLRQRGAECVGCGGSA